MANGYRGEVEIEIGGRVRTMRIGFNEMAALEQRLDGRSIMRLLQENNFGAWALRETLYVGLARGNPKITPNKVGEWIGEDITRMGYYVSKVTEALMSFMPKQVADEEEAVAAAPLAVTAPEPGAE